MDCEVGINMSKELYYTVWKRSDNDEELLIQILFEGDLSSVKEEFAKKGYVVVNQYSVPDFGEIFLNVIKVETLI